MTVSFKKFIALFAAALMLVVASFGSTGAAQAQDDEPIFDDTVLDSAVGGFDLNPQPDPSGATGAENLVGGTGGGDATGGLAVTGVEHEVGATIAIGLLAVGGSFLVTSRRTRD